MTDVIYIQSALLSLLGGAVMALCVEYLIPSFGISKITINKAMVAITTVGSLFWITWMLPQVILLVTTGRPIFVIVILTIIFVFYLFGLATSTAIIGRLKGGHLNL